MTDEDIVAALAQVLEERFSYATSYATVIVDWDEEAAALAPTVRRVAEQRAAEELLAAADEWVGALEGVVKRLNARAAALTATPNHGTDAT